jgi:hypothetical protein
VLEESATLGAGSWSRTTAEPALAGDTLRVTVSPAVDRKFYRLSRN